MNNRTTLSFTILCAVFLFICSGCNDGNPKTVEVKGKVSMDGVPLDGGSINFVSIDGDGPSGGGAITNGTYTAQVPPGQKRVLVLGTKHEGSEPLYKDMPDSPTREVYNRVTPSEYNDKEISPLKADIKAKTDNLDFDVPSTFTK